MAGRAVFYHIPEDGDVEDHPNFFSLPKRAGDKVTLGAVKSGFPLPGAYHFRFKKAFKKTYVWLDVQNDNDVVPLFEGHIAAKVSRLHAPSGSSNRETNEKHSASSQAVRSGSTAAGGGKGKYNGVTNPAPAVRKNSGGDDLLGLDFNSSPSIHTQPTVKPPVVTPAANAAQANKNTNVSNGAAGTGAGAFHAMDGNSVGSSHVMDLDWSSAPSLSPSPPLQPSSMPSSTPMQAQSLSSQAGSTKTAVPKPKPVKQSLQVPADLSSAAKDFTL